MKRVDESRTLGCYSYEQGQRCLCCVQAPTTSPLLEGRWKLLYTSRPGTASPIQQTFVGVQAFSVYQEVLVGDSGVRVNNIVSFGNNIGQLKVYRWFFNLVCSSCLAPPV